MGKKTVRIPDRFDPTSACWEGEIESTGDTAKDLGRAVLEALKSGANLSRANLFGAYLSGANLSRANLFGANLSGANLFGANLSRAECAELVIARTRILPEGAIIGWKKLQDGILAKLRIPEGAKRSHAFGRKCRAEFAEVLELLNPDGSNAPAGSSQHDPSFVYRVGDVVRPKRGFSEDWMEECAPGVHFFISKIEAENY